MNWVWWQDRGKMDRPKGKQRWRFKRRRPSFSLHLFFLNHTFNSFIIHIWTLCHLSLYHPLVPLSLKNWEKFIGRSTDGSSFMVKSVSLQRFSVHVWIDLYVHPLPCLKSWVYNYIASISDSLSSAELHIKHFFIDFVLIFLCLQQINGTFLQFQHLHRNNFLKLSASADDCILMILPHNGLFTVFLRHSSRY